MENGLEVPRRLDKSPPKRSLGERGFCIGLGISFLNQSEAGRRNPATPEAWGGGQEAEVGLESQCSHPGLISMPGEHVTMRHPQKLH